MPLNQELPSHYANVDGENEAAFFLASLCADPELYVSIQWVQAV